ncbi:MAG: metal-dependent transcriptional regulator [Euryarchaeota archaeon]|nr:metal-dependent transcriptional regulator [Euryarchaeota archaeon]
MEPSENIEEYLETLWIFEENGVALARISEIAQRLSISRPSAVEMLKKLEERGYVAYKEREGVKLTKRGRKAAEQIIRNHRLIELLIKNTLNAEIDEKVVCGIEHHMTEEFANTLCRSLNHPRQCPHGNEIPRGKCCK